MLGHTLAAAWRVLKNDVVFSVLTLTSLAAGCTCALLVGVYVVEELNYERFIDGAAQIARVEVARIRAGEKPFETARAPSGLSPLMIERVVDLEAHTRVAKQWFTVQIDDTQFNHQVSFVESGYFDVFPLKVQHGDVAAALADASSVILAHDTAIKLFGVADALGRTVRLNPFSELRVAAVLAPLPTTTHLDPEIIAPLNSTARRRFRSDVDTTLDEFNVSFYVRSTGGNEDRCFASAKRLSEAVLQQHADASSDPDQRGKIRVDVTPIVDLHLQPAKVYDLSPHGDPEQLALFAAVAVLVLLVAGFNYITMSLARAFSQAREVGIRKTLGAQPRHIAVHYLCLSCVFTVGALIIGFGCAELAMSWFSAGVGRELGQGSLHRGDFLVGAGIGGVVLALIVGAYPAIFLARQPPVSAIGGRTLGGRGLAAVSRSLLLAQLTASTVLLIVVVTMANQARFLSARPIGFEYANRLALLGVNYGPLETVKRFRTFARGLSRHPAIRSVGAANAMPNWNYERQVTLKDEGGNGIRSVYLDVDLDFFKTLGTRTLAGRTFNAERGEDRVLEDKPFGRPAVVPAVLSREAANRLAAGAWRDVVGRTFRFDNGGFPAEQITVVGVVEDLHYRSLRFPNEPMVFLPNPGFAQVYLVHFDPEQSEAALDAVRDVWRSTYPGHKMSEAYLDDEMAQLYREEQEVLNLVSGFGAVALLLSCLGLYGMSAFATQRRTREIGMRKVLGAKRRNILALMLFAFVRPAAIAAIASLPIGYFAASHWLDGFAYRVSLAPSTFIQAILVVFVAALVASLYNAMRAASVSPARALRHE